MIYKERSEKMNYQIINLEKLDRKEHFEYYLNNNATYDITINFDISKTLPYLKKHQYSFYAFCLYTLNKVINEIDNFRYDFKDEQLILWDTLQANFTVLNQDSKLFSILTCEGNSFEQYHRNYQNVIKQTKLDSLFPLEEYQENYYNVSSDPWYTFSSLSLAFQDKKPNLKPAITFAKYFIQDDQILLPMSLHVHHATVDGYHINQLVQKFQNYLNHPETI